MAEPTPFVDVKNFARMATSVAFTGLTNNMFSMWVYGTEDTPGEVVAAEYFARVANVDDATNSSPNKQFGKMIRNDDLIYIPNHKAFYVVTDEVLGTVVAMPLV